MTKAKQRNAANLERAGFVPFEVAELALGRHALPNLSCAPYVKRLIRDREHELRAWLRAGKSRDAWLVYVMRLYVDNGWQSVDRESGLLKADPWVMLRRHEDKYKRKQPQYESPWEKKQRRPDFSIAKYRRTIAKQQGSLA